MPRYIIQRNLGKVTLQEVEAAGRKSKQVREASFPDITWEHSHVVQPAASTANPVGHEMSHAVGAHAAVQTPRSQRATNAGQLVGIGQ